MSVIRTERGWAGHCCVSRDCLFRRNTLLQKDNVFVVVSTVGNWIPLNATRVQEIGAGRFFETMVFLSKESDQEYHDIDASKQIHFDANWNLLKPAMDNEANDMHEAVVEEITDRLYNNTLMTLSQ